MLEVMLTINCDRRVLNVHIICFVASRRQDRRRRWALASPVCAALTVLTAAQAAPPPTPRPATTSATERRHRCVLRDVTRVLSYA